MHRRGFLTASLLTLNFSAARASAQATPVVLELFTSQGCSSCPPADAFLGELIHRPGVIALAWHVDYWNNLGWSDPYARRAWTDRQKEYAKSLNADVFTPALVVNGAAILVGSDKAAVREAIGRAAPPPLGVTLQRTSSGLEVEIGTSTVPVTGMLVTYDPEHATQVGAGENQGRRLQEYHVVRDVTMLDRPAPRLTLPSIPENRGAVLLLQDASRRVIGAADLPPVQGS